MLKEEPRSLSTSFPYFLTGGVGTGKSHLLNAIHYEATRLLSPLTQQLETMLLVAYTGTAAFNTSGQTIHSAFNIHSFRKKYIPLYEDKLNELKLKYRSLHLLLLIIDEISMVDRGMLNYISCRLDIIKQTIRSNLAFGKISVLAA